MGSSAIPAAVMARDPEALRAAVVGELVPVIASNVDPQTWDPRELPGVGGNTWQAVIWQERIWYRDEDSLVDHDELTCIRLLDGVTYLTNDVTFPGFVLSRTLATPPLEVDRVYGDAHRVPAGATDEWAGHEDDVAMWTARGYRFRLPGTGDLHYVVDEAGYEHFSADDIWEDGFGALVFENGSVRPNGLLIRSWAIENQTTNTLPSTGPAGEQYIVGPAPTGVAVGQSKKIAWRPATDAAFIFTAPFVGEVVYDKALAVNVRWTGTAWIPAGGAMSHRERVSGAASLTITGGTNYSYIGTPTTAPTSAALRSVDAAVNYAADDAAAELQLIWHGVITISNGSSGPAANQLSITAFLLRDSEVNAIAWKPPTNTNPFSATGTTYHIPVTVRFNWIAGDTSAHDYKVGFTGIDSGGNILTYVSAILGSRDIELMGYNP